MAKSREIDQLAKALGVAQAELKPAVKNADNPFLKSKYADLTSVWDACRAVLPKHGLSVSQTSVRGEGVALRTTLMHTSGQWIDGVMEMPLAKKDPQSFGSALTYARRYSLAEIVGVVTDDDDGAGATLEYINDNQLATLEDMLSEYDVDRPKFLSWAKVGQLSEIPAANYNTVFAALKAKAAK